MMRKIVNKRFLELVLNAESVLVFTHKMPDGDAIGSALAIKHILTSAGKKTDVCCEDKSPERYKFLKGSEDILKPDMVDKSKYDLAFSVDASDEGRLGSAYQLFESFENRVQMDHHSTNTNFAMENEVDPDAPASGVLAMRLAEALKVKINKDIAMCIYTATSTDTGNFCFSGVGYEVFNQMAKICKTDFSLSDCAKRIHLMKSYNNLKLRARAIESLRSYENGRLNSMSLSLKDFADFNALQEDADGIVNTALYVDKAELCFMGIEDEAGIKFSLRAVEGYDVSKVAAKFAGGGHKLASGCYIKESLDKAMNMMLAAMLEELKT